MRFIFLFLTNLLFASSAIRAQNDNDSNTQKQTIRIINANVLGQETGVCLINNVSEPCEIQVLKGNVILSIDQTVIHSDSLRINKLEKKIEAFRGIHIIDHENTHVYGMRLLYLGKEKKLWIYDNVKVINKGDTLFTQELLYDKKNNVTQYFKQGEIHTSNGVITSGEATYFLKQKKSVLKRNVVMKDSAFVIYADSVEYVNDADNTKLATFISNTKISLKKGQNIYTNSGFYNVLNNNIVLNNYSKIIDSGRLYTAKHIDYNTKTKEGVAYQNFILFDSANNLILKADTVYFNTMTNSVNAKKNCFGQMVNEEKETIYFKANAISSQNVSFKEMDRLKKTTPKNKKDTDEILLSEIIKDTTKKSRLATSSRKSKTIQSKTNLKKDSLIIKDSSASFLKKDSIRSRNVKDSVLKNTQSPRTIDTTILYRYIKASGNVKLFKDSAQIICDSFWYDDLDSMFRFMKRPVVWMNEKMQLTADTINGYMLRKQIDSIVAQNKAISIEHLRDNFFNQTEADFITVKLDSNKIKKIYGIENVVTHYFLENEAHKISGMNRLSAKTMQVVFANQKPKSVKYTNGVKGKTFPLKKLLIKEAFLPRFVRYDSLRPKSKFEFINFQDSIRLPDKMDFFLQTPYFFK